MKVRKRGPKPFSEQSQGVTRTAGAEERYRAFIAQSSEGIWRFEMDQPIPTALTVDAQVTLIFQRARLAECNMAFARMYGYDQIEPLIDLPLTRFVTLDDAKIGDAFVRFVTDQYRATDVESDELDRHGNRRIFLNNYTGTIEDGHLVRMWGTQRDITKQRQAERELIAANAALRTTEEKFELAQGVSRTGVWDWNPMTGECTWSNSQWALYGLPHNQQPVTYELWLSRVYPEDRAAATAAIETAIKTGRHYTNEYRVVHDDGAVMWIGSRGQPIRSSDGRVTRMIGIDCDVTARRLAEQTVRDSEERLDLALRGADLGLWDIDIASGAVIYNARWAEMLGYTLAEVVPHVSTWHKLVHPDDRQRIWDMFQDHVHGKTSAFENEHRLRHKDGHWVWVLDRGRVVERDAQNRPVRAAGTHLDITARKEAEQRLLDSQRMVERIARASPLVIYVFDIVDQRTVYASRELGCDLGYSPEQVQAMRPSIIPHLMHPEDLAALPATFARWTQVEDGQVVETSFRMRHANGSWRWFSGTDVVFTRDAAGGVREIIGTMQDVTDRRNVETAIADSEERSRLVAEATTDGIWEWDIGTQQIHWSDRMYQVLMLDRSSFKLTFDAAIALVHPEDLPHLRAEYDRCLINRSAYVAETRLRRGDGEWRVFESRGIARCDNSGRPSRITGSIRDVTDRKLAEKAIREARDAAEAANKSKDQFLAILSHELRTPLTPVLLTASSLLADPSLPRDVHESISLIREQVELEGKLIDDLLDLTRIGRGKFLIQPRTLELHSLIERVLENHSQMAFASNIKISADLCAERTHLHADPVRMRQVLSNLVGNALKFTPSGGRVVVRTSNYPADMLLIEVSDTGIGMDDATLAAIFKPFEQGERNITRKYGGLGLGLTIGKAIVDMHGGTLSAFSAGKERGSSFVVLLPLGASVVLPAEPMLPRLSTPPGSCRLLLVEDHAPTSTVLMRALERAGYRVTHAADFEAALKAAQTQEFDLLISDIALPDRQGWDLPQTIGRKIKAISFSGYGSDADIQKSRDSGFAQHLVKPVVLNDLLDAVAGLARK